MVIDNTIIWTNSLSSSNLSRVVSQKLNSANLFSEAWLEVKMKRIALVIFVVGISLIASADFASLDRQWKARGLQAGEKIERLKKKNGDSEGKNLSKKELCQWDLENVYYAFVHPNLSKLVRQNSGSGGEMFKAVFMDPSKSDGKQITQVNFVYLRETSTKPDFIIMPLVAEGGSFTYLPAAPKLISVRSDRCTFIFNVEDPLSGEADSL